MNTYDVKYLSPDGSVISYAAKSSDFVRTIMENATLVSICGKFVYDRVNQAADRWMNRK